MESCNQDQGLSRQPGDKLKRVQNVSNFGIVQNSEERFHLQQSGGVSGFRPVNARIPIVTPNFSQDKKPTIPMENKESSGNDICARTTPVNHTTLIRWQHQQQQTTPPSAIAAPAPTSPLISFDRQYPQLHHLSPISIDTNRFASHYSAGPLSAPGALSGLMQSSSSMTREDERRMLSYKSHMSNYAEAYMPNYDSMMRSFQLPIATPTPIFPSPFGWNPNPYLMWPHPPPQQLFNLWNPWSHMSPPPAHAGKPHEQLQQAAINRDVATNEEEECKVEDDKESFQIGLKPNKTESQEQQDEYSYEPLALVKRERKTSTSPTEQVDIEHETPEDSKVFSGLEVLSKGAEIVADKERRNSLDHQDHKQPLEVLCSALDEVEEHETHKEEPYYDANSAPYDTKRLILPNANLSPPRSRSLDSCMAMNSNYSRRLSRRYKSVETEREAKAFIASKVGKLVNIATDNNCDNTNSTMTEWEKQVRHDMAKIQQEYKEKYKQLYKLEHSKSNKKSPQRAIKSEPPTHNQVQERRRSIKDCWEAKQPVEKVQKLNGSFSKPHKEHHHHHHHHHHHNHSKKVANGKSSKHSAKKTKRKIEEWSFASKVISPELSESAQLAEKIVDLPVLRLKKRSSSRGSTGSKGSKRNKSVDKLEDNETSKPAKISKLEEEQKKVSNTQHFLNGIEGDVSEYLQLRPSELKKDMPVLIKLDGYFHQGKLTEICPPDVYGVIVEHERGRKPHIFSAEEILLGSTREVIPRSLADVPVGQRVCAFWSKTYKHLYPGHIGDPSLIDSKLDPTKFVHIELDDGDSREVLIEDIRLLPKNFPFKERPSNDIPPTSFESLEPKKETNKKKKKKSHSTNKTNSKRHEERKQKIVKKETENNKKKSELSIASFLPANRLWTWCPHDPGVINKKSGRTSYKRIVRDGKEVLRVGDCAVFLSAEQLDRPFIGRVDAMWETKAGCKRVRVKWFYHACEVRAFGKVIRTKGALFESNHFDENDIQTISHKCQVHTYSSFKNISQKLQQKQPQKEMENLKNCENEEEEEFYFLAGSYDPLKKAVSYEKDIDLL